MNFWSTEHLQSDLATALIGEGGECLSYRELNQRVEQAAVDLRELGSRRFGVLYMSNCAASVIAYLACLRAGHVPLLLPVNLAPDLSAALIRHYAPHWVMGANVQGEILQGSGLRISASAQSLASNLELAPQLALLLSTSGSTGSPRLVRLSYTAIQANASSIAEYLSLGPGERALTVLPPYYSYGLSVINSHLASKSSLVLREVSVISPGFAEAIQAQSVTSIAGVPYTYQMLHRTGFQNKGFPSLRTLTQAGGRLDDRLTRAFAELAQARDWHFYVMYGQTEATARISYIPADRVLDKIGSIGIAIPRGQLQLDPTTDEIVYHGPNVMLGYAQAREDLALGDELNGVLRTGDLGRCDEQGFFYVTGRIKRFIKLAGNRIGLDEVEQLLQRELGLPVALSGRDERLVVWLESETGDALESANPIDTTKKILAEKFGIHHSLCRISCVERLPLLPTGKIDYNALLVNV